MKYFLCITALLFSMINVRQALAQQNVKYIHGNLKNASGVPIKDAEVSIVEHPAIKTSTNIKGNFIIRGRAGQHLNVKAPNGDSEEVPIKQDTMKLTFGGGNSIPIGFGQSRNKDGVTAAISVVKAKNLPERSSIIDPGNMLYGKLPGLIALETVNIPNYRYPDNHPNFLIRGRGTFTNSTPLILIDGFQAGFPGELNSVNPGDIASVSVLKDAAATAIYGERGANGVILVRTKRGGNHPLSVNISTNQAISKPVGLPHMLDAYNYANALNEARQNDGLPARYGPRALQAFKTGNSPYFYPNVNWFNKVLRNHGFRTNYNINFNGGSDKVRYFASMHYMHNAGFFGPVHRNNDYSSQYKTGSFGLRTNLDINLTDNLVLSANLGARIFALNKPHGPVNQIINNLYTVPSAAFPVKTFDGNWGGTKFYSNNPVAQLTDRGFESPNFKEVLLKAKLRQNLDMWTKGLSIEADLGYDNFGAFFPRKTKSYRYEAISPVYNQSGNITDTTKTLFGQNTNLTYLHSFVHLVRRSDLEGKMNYKRSFGNHSVSAMFLFHQSKFVARGINNQTDWRNFAGNIHYGYNNTYFFNATASYSGKNLLPEGNRYHFFPALSAAWLISNEHFLQNVSFLDLLKLKASWGIVGSDLLPMNDPYVQHYSFGGGYNFGDNNAGVPAMYEETLPTKDFTVEQSHEENVGINVRMFSHLSLKADLFYSHRTHILVGSGGLYSTVLGIAPPLKTNGIVDNEGFETSLNWQQIIGDISWNIGGWVSYTHNKIVNENEQPRARPYLRRTGREVGQLFGLQAIGFFKNQQDIAHSPKQEFSTVEPGDIKYKDQNGDDVINQLDEVPLGHHLGYPNIYYSFNLGIRYKGIGLSALFQGTGQYTAYLNTPSVYWPLTNNTTISKYYYEHRWTSSNSATATLPRLTTEANANNFRMNSIWLVSKAYLKLRYVKIYYLFPQSLLKGTHIHSIEVYAQGRDLYSWDHIPVGTTQEFGASYPIARFYSLGFNINF